MAKARRLMQGSDGRNTMRWYRTFLPAPYNTDWQDEIYRAGISHDHNVSVTGGVGNESWSMPYRVSVGYTNQEGILKGSDYNRFTAGFTLNPSLLNDHLNFNINAQYSYSKTTVVRCLSVQPFYGPDSSDNE